MRQWRKMLNYLTFECGINVTLNKPDDSTHSLIWTINYGNKLFKFHYHTAAAGQRVWKE